MKIEKIFIDSKFKRPGETASRFSIEIDDTITFNSNTYCMITDIVIPYSYYNVNYSNKHLYFRISTASIEKRDFVISIPEQHYDVDALCFGLREAINNALLEANINLQIDVNPLLLSGGLTFEIIEGTGRFKLFTDEEMKTISDWTSLTHIYNSSTIYSINNIIGNVINRPLDVMTKTKFIDLLYYHSFYICSPELTNNTIRSNNNLSNIIKKVVNNGSYGNIIYDNNSNTRDILNISNRTIKTLHFFIVDEYNNMIDFNGRDLSFSLLLFNKE